MHQTAEFCAQNAHKFTFEHPKLQKIVHVRPSKRENDIGGGQGHRGKVEVGETGRKEVKEINERREGGKKGGEEGRSKKGRRKGKGKGKQGTINVPNTE
jgi:hypothetical protein